MTTPPDDIVVRPNSAKYLHSLRRGAPVLIVAFSSIAIVLGVPGRRSLGLGWWGVLIALIVFAMSGGLMWMYLTNSVLAAGSGYIVWIDWRRRRTQFVRADLTAILRRGVLYGTRSAANRTFFIGAQNRQLIVLDDRLWDEDALAGVWTNLGMAPEGSFKQIVTPSLLNVEYPGLVPWWQMHTTMIGVVVTPLVIAAIAVVITISPQHH